MKRVLDLINFLFYIVFVKQASKASKMSSNSKTHPELGKIYDYILWCEFSNHLVYFVHWTKLKGEILIALLGFGQ